MTYFVLSFLPSFLNAQGLQQQSLRRRIAWCFPVSHWSNQFVCILISLGKIFRICSTILQDVFFSPNLTSIDGLLLLCRDISSNNLSGQLPLSMENLSSLTTLWAFFNSCFWLFGKVSLASCALSILCPLFRHVQNNHLSGMLNILQDLPLQDL